MKSRGKMLAVLVALLMVVSLVFTGCGGANSGEKEPDSAEAPEEYKIGFLAPLTGDCAFWGIRGKEAAELAAEKINAEGGINGAKLVIEFEDTRGEKTEVANIVQRYASDPSILGICGSVLSGSMFVGGPIADSNGVLMCGFATTAKGIPQIGEYVFRIATTSDIGTRAMFAYAKENYGIESIAILSSMNNDFSVDAHKTCLEAAEEVGLEVVADETYSDGDTNFTAQINKIMKAKPDAIMMAGYATEGSLAILEAKKQGFEGLFMGGDGMIDADTLTKIGGEATEGMLLYGGYSAEYDNPVSKEFVKKFREKYGHDPEAAAGAAYDVILIMAKAMKQSGPDRAAFRDAFAQTKDFQGVSGSTSFDENREVVKTTFILEFKDGFFKLVGTK